MPTTGTVNYVFVEKGRYCLSGIAGPLCTSRFKKKEAAGGRNRLLGEK